MCGIVGYLGRAGAGPFLLEGLRRLEYRGYDSVGLAVLNGDGELLWERRPGRLPDLRARVAEDPRLNGHVGIGHTRWATHGPATAENAHPHTDCTGRVYLVHNGIVENWEELRRGLEAAGHRFRSETDTEVLCHLVEEALGEGEDPLGALRRALGRVRGHSAVALLLTSCPHLLLAGRRGLTSPLAVGRGPEGLYLASDLLALGGFAREAFLLPSDRVVALSGEGVRVVTLDGREEPPSFGELPVGEVGAEAGGYEHFYLKEVYEQPEVVARLAEGALRAGRLRVDLPLGSFRWVHLVGMGSSLHAALLGRWFLHRLAGQPAAAVSASEAGELLLGREDLLVAITQSGETADTLAAIAHARSRGARVLVLCNRAWSAAAREADAVLGMEAGPEQCVVATKTFTASLALLYLLALAVGEARGRLEGRAVREGVEALARLPQGMREVLDREVYREAALRVARHEHLFVLGRGPLVPIALEGALKLKEAAYLHAEGLPAGDLKHGPLALIQPSVLTLALAFAAWEGRKTLSGAQEVRARGGPVLLLGDMPPEAGMEALPVPPAPSADLQPLLAVLPLQLLAYYAGVLRGCDVDRPRNLAKSVTVE